MPGSSVVSDEDSAVEWSEFGPRDGGDESENPVQEESRDETNEVKKMTKNENTGVCLFKFLMVLSIVLAAALVSGGAYYMLHQEETDAFETSVRTPIQANN